MRTMMEKKNLSPLKETDEGTMGRRSPFLLGNQGIGLIKGSGNEGGTSWSILRVE